MNTLLLLKPVVIGPAGGLNAGCCRASRTGLNEWSVSWRGPDAQWYRSVTSVGQMEWSRPVPLEDEACLAPSVAEGMIAPEHTAEGGRFRVRLGRRIQGRRPSFPSAGVIICQRTESGWSDFAIVDETPDIAVDAYDLLETESAVLLAYVSPGREGTATCQAVAFRVDVEQASPLAQWHRLPDYPLGGMGGLMAGEQDGVIICAGGSNFPKIPMLEGGRKEFYDDIFVLLPGAAGWRQAGRLPAPRGYGTAVKTARGVLLVGGENSQTVFGDSLLLRWNGDRVEIQPGPVLPAPVTNAAGVTQEGFAYVAGGFAPESGRTSKGYFWQLDVDRWELGWTVLESWPGPPRGQAVIASAGNAIYVFSGLELGHGMDGSEFARYLCDGYRYRPQLGWERLPDLPWSVVAAPTPAPVPAGPARILIFGGVDGRQQGNLPHDARTPDDVLCFDVERQHWSLLPEIWPDPVVTVPCVQVRDGWMIISGEILGGIRTVRGWHLTLTPACAVPG